MSTKQFLVSLFSVLILFQLEEPTANGKKAWCIDEEREALLSFKESLVDDFGILSSWGSEDDKRNCCNWSGVSCSNFTGHVIKLSLRGGALTNMHLKGKMISPALIKLHDLRELDLSGNDFGGSPVPKFIGSFSQLRYLCLSDAKLAGPIPSYLGNLSRLQLLDIGGNDLFSVGNLDWLSHLSSLRELYLTGSDLTKSSDLFQVIGNLHALKSLYLPYCVLPPINPSSISHMNFSTSIEYLDLSSNNLTSSVYPWLFNFTRNVVFLYLYNNQLQGPIPEAFQHMVNLEELGLGYNKLEGGIPKFFGGFLYLKMLSLTGNSLTGVVSEAVFSNLSNLSILDLADNSLALNFSFDWVPPFQLVYIYLGSCKMGPHFPKWLQTQKNINQLDISGAGIVGTVPDWFWDLSNTTYYLNMSNNLIKGRLPDLSFRFKYLELDISSNNFEGTIPRLPSNASFLNLSNNTFSGSISSLCSVSGNKLEYIDLSNNFLSGTLPDCWLQFDSLVVLNLANNNFFGKIPGSIGFLHNIQSLSLYNNNFTGEVPSFLRNCSQLILMDLGQNGLSGELPKWIGKSLPNLVVLILKSNKLYGDLTDQLCLLAYIQILDLSLNNISGKIPKCFNHFIAMTQKINSNPSLISSYVSTIVSESVFRNVSRNYLNKVTLTWKGVQYEYKSILGLVNILDLSSNQLGGEVPAEIMDLVGLVALNLSRNNLTGQINPKIGQLVSLDFLDLSRNYFFGAIPYGLSQLSGLSVMDLSHNNLSGKIPTGTQLQSFNASVYAENPELCGLPLPSKCPDEQSAPRSGTDNDVINTPEDDEDDEFMTLGFYLSLILGFFFGFWGVCGTLLVKSSWRRSYYHFLTDIKDWVYVRGMLHIGKLQRKFRN